MHRTTAAGPVAAGLVLAALLTGCTSREEESGAGADAGTVVEVTVSIRDGAVTPAPRRVEVPLGGEVRLLVTSDVDDDVHVHGYDVEGELVAGRPTTVEFVADQSGVFEVETHDSELELVQLEVR